MSKRAEEAAFKAYPFLPTNVNNDIWDDNKEARAVYQEGYQQAEKDLSQYAQLWVDSGEANIKSFQQFLKDRGYD